MDWGTARIRLEHATCPVTRQLQNGQRFRCMSRGQGGHPFGSLKGNTYSPWETALRGDDANWTHLPTASCQACPIAALPTNVYALKVEAHSDGVDVDVTFPNPQRLRVYLDRLEAAGQAPRLAGQAKPGSPPRAKMVLDADLLTERQREALQTAAALGYFTPGRAVDLSDLAREMGCSRSTAHEHLRKGLGRLLEASFRGAERQEPAQVAPVVMPRVPA